MGDSHIDYQQMLEDHGYKTEYKDGVAIAWAFGDCYSLGSAEPNYKNGQFHHIAIALAKEGEPFSGWSKDIVIEVDGVYKYWGDVYG